MYKVFIQNNSISFIESLKNPIFENQEYSEWYAKQNKNLILKQLNDKKTNIHCSIFCQDSFSFFQFFFSEYEKISAAGGIVQCNDSFLIIKRHGVWDLPKGKVEKNEVITSAAIREIEEETGISNLIIEKKLLDTYHTYSIYGPDTLKTTTWFLMSTDDLHAGTPQLEEAITEIRWVKKDELNDYFSDSFGNLKLVVDCVLA